MLQIDLHHCSAGKENAETCTIFYTEIDGVKCIIAVGKHIKNYKTKKSNQY